jgi:PPOX class probable F420-dependent enzyme
MINLDTKFGRKVKRRLKNEQEIWLTTTGLDGTPQPRPVWFWWDGETFLIYSQPSAHKLKHIAKNRNVAVHFNTGNADPDLVVLHGTAMVDRDAPPSLKHKQYVRKYRKATQDIKMTPEQLSAEYSVAIRVTPYKLWGW